MDSLENQFRAWEIEQELHELRQQMRNPKSAPRSTGYSPPTSGTESLEDKFRAWEIERELQDLKQKGNPYSSRNSRGYSPPASDRDRQFYRILGLTPGASSAEIKKAYRNLAKQWHPDRFVGDPRMQRQAREKFHQINEAYQALRSP